MYEFKIDTDGDAVADIAYRVRFSPFLGAAQTATLFRVEGVIDRARDVRDVVAAYLLLLEQAKSGEVYNVCSGSEQSIRELLMRLLQLAGVEAAVEPDPSRLRPAEGSRFDVIGLGECSLDEVDGFFRRMGWR